MIAQLVRFKSGLPRAEVLGCAEDRLPMYRATPGLVQKYYLEFRDEDTYGGFLIWESAEALAAFRETDLAKTIASAYGAVDVPEVAISDVFTVLRD